MARPAARFTSDGSLIVRLAPAESPAVLRRWIVHDRQPDASDVVGGPVGDADLKDPSTNPGMGADLDALPTIETDEGDAPERREPPAED